MNTLEISLIQSTINHGRLYFARTDKDFFPLDCFGDRKKSGYKGDTIIFSGAGLSFETFVRVLSGTRISPQRSFAPYLRSVAAKPGGVLRVTRCSARLYSLEYLG